MKFLNIRALNYFIFGFVSTAAMLELPGYLIESHSNTLNILITLYIMATGVFFGGYILWSETSRRTMFILMLMYFLFAETWIRNPNSAMILFILSVIYVIAYYWKDISSFIALKVSTKKGS